MNGGGSRAQLVQGSDGKYYIVKLIGNPQGTRILGNEFVTGKLAAILDAPCPLVCAINTDQVMVDNINRTCGTSFRPGIQFAQEYLGNRPAQVFPSNPELMSKTANLRKWANAIVLDSLVQNEDLKDTHVLITLGHQGSESEFWHIDHGHCLGVGRGWNTLIPENTPIRSPLYSNLISGPNPFGDVFERLQKLNERIIRKMFCQCPLSAWEIPPFEVNHLVTYLLAARNNVQNTIIACKNNFPNWESHAREL